MLKNFMSVPHSSLPAPLQEPRLLAACLCAQWCATCREYRAHFDAAKALFPNARWLWVDIEDQSQLVEPLELDDFPTLLLAVNGRPTFFGNLTPQPETLSRLLHSKLGLDAPGLHDHEATALLERLEHWSVNFLPSRSIV